MSDAFATEGLVKRFGRATALAGVDLAAPPGTVLGLLGPNGAGKTTAVRILATLLRPDEGRAWVCGRDVVADPHGVRRLIGLNGQDTTVDADLTGRENLVLFARLLGASRAQGRAAAAELLDRFGLDDAAERRVATYSGGMRRRLDLAACLVGRPRVVFLDEPTTGLDPSRREEVWRMVRGLAADGVGVLLTTQYLEEADALADRIAVVDHGRVVARGTPADLKRRAGRQTVAVHPTDPGRIDDVAAILRQAAGRTPEAAGRGVLTVTVDDDAVFMDVVRRVDAAGIGVEELSLRLPSLDEVFAALTGRPPDGRQPDGQPSGGQSRAAVDGAQPIGRTEVQL